MSPRESRMLIIAMVAGLALAAGGYWVGLRRAASTVVPATATTPSAQAPAAAATAEGTPTAVRLTPDEEEVIALSTAEVTRRDLRSQLITVGKVDEAETRLASISARVGGRIEKLHVTFTGQPVARGQAVADIYSPELLNAAQEYRLALDNRQRMGGGASPDAMNQAEELVAASRKRLELWGLTSAQLDKLASDPTSGARVTTYASAAGVVIDRKVTEGQYVNAGDTLYTVADLSSVWVKLDVYEADLRLVRVGDPVEMTCESVPGTLRGRVDFIDTTVNHDTRTAALRVQVANPGMRLRPGMYVRATIAAAPQNALAVPRSAVIDTGTHTIVYIARGNGVYESREVKAGQAVGEFVPVSAGLAAGERVVTEATFLVDSQTRITGGMTSVFGGSKGFGDATKGVEAPPAPAQEIKVEFSTSPDPPRGDAKVTYHVRLSDPSGKPVADAQVHVTIVMPAMPAMNMGEVRAGEDLKWNGSEYAAAGNIPAPGSWNTTVTVTRGGQTVATYRTTLKAR